MEKYEVIRIEERSRFEATCRKVAMELFNKPFRYLNRQLAGKVKRIAFNRLVTG